jgi:MFS family permease
VLGVAAAAPRFAVFAFAVAVLGVTAVVAQIVVAMSSSLAAEQERGRVVGTVMSGLPIGILSARIISGIAAQLFGWRVIYAIAAAAVVVLAAVLRTVLPRVPPTERLSYPQLLGSVLSLVRGEPLLRQRMLLGATAFGRFSILWTSVAFLLSGSPYHYGNAVIGLFGLAGLAGALIAGIVVLDLGAQAMHISNQSAVYSLHGQARSRLTTAYMVAYFLGGVTLSAAASALYASGGWEAVCAPGAGTAAVGLISWIVTERVMTGRLPIGGDSAA